VREVISRDPMGTVREGFLALDSDAMNRFASRTVAGTAIFNTRISRSDVHYAGSFADSTGVGGTADYKKGLL
jgi:hypothetical protein